MTYSFIVQSILLKLIMGKYNKLAAENISRLLYDFPVGPGSPKYLLLWTKNLRVKGKSLYSVPDRTSSRSAEVTTRRKQPVVFF